MTDQIPADKVRAMATRFRQQVEPHTPFTEYVVWERAAEAVESLLPPTPRPTLADMTDEERAACQWMQADVGVERRIIMRVMDVEEGAVTLVESGDTVVCPHSSVTPRPDLPRLEWPGTGQDGEEATKVDYVSVAGGRTAYGPWTVARLRKKPGPAPALPDGWRLADHEDHGRGIVTNPTPSRDGRVYFVTPADEIDEVLRMIREDARIPAPPRIIRTTDELAALDPDTMLATRGLVSSLPLEILWHLDSPPESVLSRDDLLPAVVISTGEHVRAARQALEAADAVD